VLVLDDNAAQVMFLQSEEDDDDQDNLREMIKVRMIDVITKHRCAADHLGV